MNIKLYPAKSEIVRWIERKEGVIILNPQTGLYHKLNRTATFIWQVCNGIRSIEEIIEEILRSYNISRDKAEKDVSSVINYFIKRGLIKLYKSPRRFYPKNGRN